MNGDRVVAESEVSGNRIDIPESILQALDVDDGDSLYWTVMDDGSARVAVVSRETGTFEDFDGYAGGSVTDVAANHDDWGLE